MTFSWVDHCSQQHGTIEANSYDELLEKIKKFFGQACGFTAMGKDFFKETFNENQK